MLGINLTSLRICAELADKLSQRGYSLTSSTDNLNGTYCSIELNTDLKLYRFTEYNPVFYNWLFSDVEAVDLIPDEALAHYLNPNQIRKAANSLLVLYEGFNTGLASRV